MTTGNVRPAPDFGDASPCSRVRLLVYFYFLSSMEYDRG